MHSLTYETLKQRLRDFGGTPERVLENEGLMQMILPILRADLRVAPARTLDAWTPYSSASFELARFTGGHFFLRTAQSPLFSLIPANPAGAAPKAAAAAQQALLA